MRLEVVCPDCGAKKWAPADAAGRKAACPRCKQVLFVPTAPAADEERPAAESVARVPTRKESLHPGWRRVARGYASLRTAMLLFFVLQLLGVAMVLYKLALPGEFGQIVMALVAIVAGVPLSGLSLIFTLMGHLHFLSTPRRAEGGGKGRRLAVAMLVCLLVPPAQVALVFLLSRFSAVIGAALDVPYLSERGRMTRVWGAVVPAFMAFLVGLIIAAVTLLTGAVAGETLTLALVLAVGILLLTNFWCLFELSHVFGDCSEIIGSQIRRRGTYVPLASAANPVPAADHRTPEREASTA